MTKTILTFAILLSASLSFAQSIDGTYKFTGMACKSGAPVNPQSVAINQATTVEYNAGNLTIGGDLSVIGAPAGCGIMIKGKYQLVGNTLTMNIATSTSSAACGGPAGEQAVNSTVVLTVAFTADGFTGDLASDGQNSSCPAGDHELTTLKKIK